MKYVVSLLAATLLAGCATGYNPTYRFKQVDVVNLAGGPLQNLSWNVVGSGKTMTCSEVTPNRICNDYFAPRRYPRAGIELSWTHVDGERKTEVINPQVEPYFNISIPLSIIIEIQPDGALNAFYRQDSPDGSRIFIRH